jgi:hypothetical protein
MPYVEVEQTLTAKCAKRVLKGVTMKYLSPAKYSVEKHKRAKLTAKQLAVAAEEYPKEYDLALGYIGKGKDE